MRLSARHFVALALFVIAVSMTSTAAPSASSRPRIVFSVSADRSSPKPVAGASLVGAVYVYLDGAPGARSVRYIVDGKVRRVASRPPFDLAGRAGSNAVPFALTPLAHGAHTLTAVVTDRAGRRSALSARFNVVRLFVAAGGSPNGPCTRERPCGTLQAAYERSRPGQAVEVAAGRYGPQELRGTKPAPRTVFMAKGGVRLDWVDVYADNVELRGFSGDGFQTYAESDNFVARDLDINIFGLYGSTNTKVIGGDVGPSYRPGGNTNVNYITYGGPDAARVPARNVLIDGVYFHDFRRGTVDDHMECLMVVGGDQVTIRNSRFERCDIFDVFFTQWAGPQPAKNVLLENNFFNQTTTDGQRSGGSLAVQFSGHMDQAENIVIRNNSFAMPLGIDATPRNFTVVGNVMPWSGCVGGVTYQFNVMQDEFSNKCGSSDKLVRGERYATDRLGYVDVSGGNLHLTSRSPAINAGDPRAFPRRDIDGNPRPRGRRPDAGADEAR
jgi:hypothetical protein